MMPLNLLKNIARIEIYAHKTAFFIVFTDADRLEVVKVYFEKSKCRTAYKKMMNFLPNHPEIETVMFFDADEAAFEAENLMDILNLYLTNENTAKLITEPEKLGNLTLFECKTKNVTR